MKFLKALIYDTIGQDDKAHDIVGHDLKSKNKQRTQTAIFCAVVAVVGAPFTMGISLALLLVSARKMQMVWKDKS